MEYDTTGRQDLERNEWKAAGNQDWYTVQSYRLPYQFTDLLAVGIQPLANVLGFYTRPARFLVADEKVQPLLPGEGLSTERFWRFFLRVETAVIVFVKVRKVTQELEGILVTKSPVDRDFEALAHPQSAISVLEPPEDRQLLIQPFLYGRPGRVCQVEPECLILPDVFDLPFLNENLTCLGEDVGIYPPVKGASVRNFLF